MDTSTLEVQNLSKSSYRHDAVVRHPRYLEPPLWWAAVVNHSAKHDLRR